MTDSYDSHCLHSSLNREGRVISSGCAHSTLRWCYAEIPVTGEGRIIIISLSSLASDSDSAYTLVVCPQIGALSFTPVPWHYRWTIEQRGDKSCLSILHSMHDVIAYTPANK